VIVALSASSARTRFMRRSETTISPPALSGTAPPHKPVLPPCGTTGVLASAHVRITPETSSVEAGRTTARAEPR
jgi:hypothetical protein